MDSVAQVLLSYHCEHRWIRHLHSSPLAMIAHDH
jgi:hypothetical protein